MRMRLRGWKTSLLMVMMLLGLSVQNVQAEEQEYGCKPTEEQIQEYKEDGTWEERKAYVEELQESVSVQAPRTYAMRGKKESYIPPAWKGMQTTGDAKLLLVRVEFADMTFENAKNYSEEELLSMTMGGEGVGTYPYESLSHYYERSSYGKLHITSDKVYTCTLSKTRDEYKDQDQNLIEEVMEKLDAEIDFNDYDANEDGILDSMCINFAGENTGWGSTWWSHATPHVESDKTFDDVMPGAYLYLETHNDAEEDINYGIKVLIHEMGHVLGLEDYYSTPGGTDHDIGTVDMMNNNCGDHNGFSKWLLGWIEEENIQRITKEDGTTEVTLSPISCEEPGDNKLIAVIAPEDTSVYSEYFVVQYDEYCGNQSIPEMTSPRFRVFHVNARLSEDGNDFSHKNAYGSYEALIKCVSVVEEETGALRDYFAEGDSLTPDTNESSAFYGGENLGFTGIEITDFKTGDEPSFKVSFREKEAVDEKLEFQIQKESVLNMANVTLVSNIPLVYTWPEEMAYYEDADGNRYFAALQLDGERQVVVSYEDIGNSLNPETEYTLVIPAGTFQVDTDVYSEECRIKIKTGVFPKEEADYEIGLNVSSNLFTLDDTKSGFLQVEEGTESEWIINLHAFEGNKKLEPQSIHFPIPGQYTEVNEIEVIPCYDGTLAVEICAYNLEDYSMIYYYYKVDQDGNILAGPFEMYVNLDTIPVGNGIKGIVPFVGGGLGAPADMEDESKLEVYTIDFKNEPTSSLINMDKFRSKMYAYNKDSYVVIQSLPEERLVVVYNNTGEEIANIDLTAHTGTTILTAEIAEDKLAVIYEEFREDESYIIKGSLFDMNGTHIKTKDLLTYASWKNLQDWNLEKASWGYVLSNNTQDSIYIFYFLDEEFNIISSMQLPILSDGVGMGNRFMAKWYDMTIYEYKVMITEPIVEDKEESDIQPDDNDSNEGDNNNESNDESNGGDNNNESNEGDNNNESNDDSTITDNDKELDDIKKDDKPSVEDKNETPETGDTKNPVMWMMTILLSGAAIAMLSYRKIKK